MFRYVYRGEGLPGFYKGFGITALGSIPAGMLYFVSYETARSFFHTFHGDGIEIPPFLDNFLAGFVAESFSCVLWVPIDVLKERLQTQSTLRGLPLSMQYQSSWDALTNTRFRVLYRGYFATLMSFGPFSAIYLALYEEVKHLLLKWNGDSTRIKSTEVLVGGLIAGSTAAFLTNPLDLVKLRLQVQRNHRSVFWGRYTGVYDGLRKVVLNEGIATLYKGVGARMLFHAPSASLSMMGYEVLKQYYMDLLGVSIANQNLNLE